VLQDRLGRTQSFSFDYPQTNASFTVTYVAGHITELDFPETHRKWNSCDPFTLFEAPIEVKHPERVNELVRNIQMHARRSDMLMIWTDCDREGEHIGSEIAQVAKKVNGRIRVTRARFSAIIPQYGQFAPVTTQTILTASLGKSIMLRRTPFISTKHKQMPSLHVRSLTCG
jgi:DNA topoisomerase IA